MKIPFTFAKDQKPMVNVLFIVATFQLLLGGLYGWFYWNSLEYSYWQGWLFVFSAPIYLTLGLAVRWIRYYSLLIGFVLYLYLTFMVHPLPYAPSGVWQDGLVLKLPILTFLLWGLLAGNDWKQLGKRWGTLLMAILIVLCGFGVQFAIRSIIELGDLASNLQRSVIGVSQLSKENRMNEIVDVFYKANSNILRKSTIAGFILGICGFGLCLMLIKLIIRSIKRKRVSPRKMTF